MAANDNVTEALRRTLGLMQNELEKSVLTAQMLGVFNSPIFLFFHDVLHHFRRIDGDPPCNLQYSFDIK
jgi:hypothetical protein